MKKQLFAIVATQDVYTKVRGGNFVKCENSEVPEGSMVEIDLGFCEGLDGFIRSEVWSGSKLNLSKVTYKKETYWISKAHLYDYWII